MNRDIQLGDDIIDSREIIARMEEIESDIRDLEDENDVSQSDLEEAQEHNQIDTLETINDEIRQREEELSDLQDELAIWKEFEYANVPDWHHGEAFINDDHFTEYAKQLAEDVCEMRNNLEWPFRHIDWEAAAEELQSDYTEVDVDNYTYWVRS